ncbi:O-antigen ligase family protein [Candidatus Margulisiibacteriota bacterium]
MKKKQFDSAIQVLLLVLLYLAAMIFDRRIGIVFSLTKASTIRLFSIITLSIWAAKILIFREHKFVRTITDWPALSYILACSVATVTSVHVYISFFGFYGRFEGLITLYNFVLLFFITTNFIKDLKSVKRIAATVCSAGVLMAIYGIIQRKGIDPYAWGGVLTWQRVIGTIGQPNFFAAYMLMAFLLTLILFLEQRKKTEHKSFNSIYPFIYFIIPIITFLAMIFKLGTRDVILWYLGFALCSICAVLFANKYEEMSNLIADTLFGVGLILIYTSLLYTQSRGGFIGFFAALSLFFILAPKKCLVDNWQKILILFLSLGIVTGITVINPEFSIFNRVAAEISVEEMQTAAKKKSKVEFSGAAGSRGETWKSANTIIANYPFFGIGPEVMKMVFPRYETDLFRFKEKFHVKQDRAHNETLDVPLTRGLPAFIFYLALLTLIFIKGIKSFKNCSDDKKLLLAGFLSAIAAYLFQNQFSFGVVAITTLLWVMGGVVVRVEALDDIIKEKESKKIKNVGVITGFGIAAVVVFAGVLIYFSYFQFRADLDFKMAKTLSEVKRYGDSLYYYNRALDVLPFEGGPITHKAISLINYGNGAAPEISKKVVGDTIDLLKYGTLVDPYNADNFYILSRIYLKKKEYSTAVSYAEQALKIDPFYAEVHLILADIAKAEDDREKAREHFREAYRLNPTLADARAEMVWDLIEQRALDQAYDLAQEILMQNPKFVAVRNAVGTIYLMRKAKAKAKVEFETVLYLDPENKYAKMMLKQ